MSAQFIKIDDLSEVSFDSLFESSIISLDASMPWPPGVSTSDQRKNVYQSHLEQAIAGRSDVIPSASASFVMFKVVIDGKDVMLSAGFVTLETYSPRWYLVGPDASGSKNWLYNTTTETERRSFLQGMGISQYEVTTLNPSPMYTVMKNRINSGKMALVSEVTTPTLHHSNIVTLTVRV